MPFGLSLAFEARVFALGARGEGPEMDIAGAGAYQAALSWHEGLQLFKEGFRWLSNKSS